MLLWKNYVGQVTFSHTAEGQETPQNFSREAHHQGAELRVLHYLVHGRIILLDLAVEKLYPASPATISPWLFEKL